jgi:hypothetical protein
MYPGMMLRVDESSFEAMKSVISRTLPHELASSQSNNKMPEEFHYKYDSRMPGCSWAIDWENIEYSDLDLRPDDITFELTRGDGMRGEIKMDIPSLKYWAISATQDFHHWYYPSKSEIIIYIENLDIDVGFDLKLDARGYLDPVVSDVKIDMGDSYIWHDNWFV